MAKITRKTQKVFAGSATNNGQFGSAQAGTKVTTTDPAVIQALAAWDTGWNSATISSQKLPTLEEMQGIQFVVTRQVAYLLQEGIAEYDSGTTYFANSIVKKTGTYELYGSKINNNVGNALPSAVSDSNWEYLGTLGTAAANPVSWGGTAGGTANALTLTPSTALTSYAAGQVIAFLAASANTAAVTVNVSALGTKSITKNGTIALTPNELVTGALYFAIYDGTQFQLINPPASAKGADVASASTINLDAATGNYVDVTGTTGITAITLREGSVKTIRFTGALTLTHGASLVLPTSANITTVAGDYAICYGYASGVVRVVYFRLAGTPLAMIQATTSVLGGVTLATNAEVVTGTDTSKVPPVSALGSHKGVAKAWVNFNGTGTVAIRSSYNVSSITDNGTGNYTLNFTNALTDANYAAVGMGIAGAAGSEGGVAVYSSSGYTTPALVSTTQLRIRTGGAVDTDHAMVSVAIFDA